MNKDDDWKIENPMQPLMCKSSCILYLIPRMCEPEPMFCGLCVDVANPNILTPSIVIWLVRPMLGQDNNDAHDNTIVPADDQNDMKYITVEEFFMKHSTLLH